MTFPKLCPKLHSDSEGCLISLTDSYPAIVGSLPLQSEQKHQLMVRAVFQRNPRTAKDKSSCSELYPDQQQHTTSCISLPRFSAARWQVSLGIGCRETHETFLILSMPQTIEIKWKQEQKFLFQFVSTIISLLYFSSSSLMNLTSSHNAHLSFPFHSTKPTMPKGFMIPLNRSTILSPFLWEHLTSWNVQPAGFEVMMAAG